MAYSAQAIRQTYDGIAEGEDKFEKGFSLRNQIPQVFIKRYLAPSAVVLDAGGGSGINAILMAQRCTRVTLMDISPRMLELAATNIAHAGLAAKVGIVQGDICSLGQFGDGEFSLVVCLGGSLSYVQEKAQQAIGELVRVARKGALLIVGCDGKYGFVRFLLGRGQLDEAVRVLEAGEYEAGDGAYARLYTAAELTGLLREAGCEILEVASTPVLADTWEQSKCPEEQREQLMALELQLCTVPELLGAGHHLFCVARKR